MYIEKMMGKLLNINEAIELYDRCLCKIERITSIVKDDIGDILSVAEELMGCYYVLMDTLLWICNYDDSNAHDGQPFVLLKDISHLRTNMPLTKQIRDAAREVCKAEKLDYKKEISQKEFALFIDSIVLLTSWISENARNKKNNIKAYSESAQKIADILLSRF